METTTDKVDEILNCSASLGGDGSEHRSPLAHWLSRSRGKLSELPGYQAWARTTRLSFGPVAIHRIPQPWIRAGYRIETALPSSDGSHVAARIARSDGLTHVGWWALDGSGQGIYQDPGYDLIWHPRDLKFAYLSKQSPQSSHRIHVVDLKADVKYRSVSVNGHSALRYPFVFSENNGYRRQAEDIILAIADPTGTPRGVAYLPRLAVLDTFDANLTPLPSFTPRVPNWVARPWHPSEPLSVSVDERVIVFPNIGGSPYGPLEIGEGARPLTLVWSPKGTTMALVVQNAEGTFAHVTRPTLDRDGREPVYRVEGTTFAVSEDGVTTFTVIPSQGDRTVVKSRNQMTGDETE